MEDTSELCEELELEELEPSDELELDELETSDEAAAEDELSAGIIADFIRGSWLGLILNRFVEFW